MVQQNISRFFVIFAGVTASGGLPEQGTLFAVVRDSANHSSTTPLNGLGYIYNNTY